MAEEKYERYCSIEESIIQACKEVNLMRKGLLPKRNWRDLWAELEQELAEEESFERQPQKIRAVAK